MSPLDQAMITSPNDEILTAIGQGLQSNRSSIQDVPDSRDWNRIPTARDHQVPALPPRSSKIGVWRDGTAIWDSAARSYQSRPNLSVVIPQHTESEEKRYGVVGSQTASPLASSLGHTPFLAQRSNIHPAFRNDNSIEPMQKRQLSTTTSELSRDSFDIASENSSTYSRTSSMTSVEDETNITTILSDLDKNTGSGFAAMSPIFAGVFDDQSKPLPRQRHLEVRRPSSPTLSEAVFDLQKQLETISEYETDQHALPARAELTRAPTIPKKSRKREWRASFLNMSRGIQEPEVTVDGLTRRTSTPAIKDTYNKSSPGQIHRTCSTRSAAHRVDCAPESEMSLSSAQMSLLFSAISSLKTAPTSPMQPVSPSHEAEAILVRIMSSLTTIQDLQAMSVINKGMYGVYRANEIGLLRAVLQKQSSAAWELREWSMADFADSDDCFWTNSQVNSPSNYLNGIRNDGSIIRELKSLILERCQSFLRHETVLALTSERDVNAKRFDDAFYRVWCFCKIFGCDKGREDDVTGQLDWLKGGLLAHEDDCAATININLEFEMGGVLLNAPEYFAKGNVSGLSSSQLYDMAELWNGLAALLAGYHDKVEQARDIGIFHAAGVESGDLAKEEATMEEWIAYILTLGPAVVLELARHSEDSNDSGLKLAELNGWTDWNLTGAGTSRRTFFREPVARLYEERLTIASSSSHTAPRDTKDQGRKRVASLAAEIKLSRNSSKYQSLPLISMGNERAMSICARRDSAVSVSHGEGSGSPLHHQAFWSGRKISPIIEERVDTFNRLSLLSLEGVAENTADVAVAKIVAMGFSASQATEALKLTDMGNGLRVDRAVDLLLRQH
ncbi:hypothetical protein AAFC00_001482 [Neodothiora populina]